MAPQIPPLDEQEFDLPYTLLGLPGGDLNVHNNQLWYFSSSQFFEPQSHNVALLNQYREAPNGQEILNDRHLFHEHLSRQAHGTQFVVAGEPQADAQPWLIQRHNKTHNAVTEQPETLVEGNWYTQGTKVLMAPSLGDVLKARLLTIATRVQQMADLANGLDHWSPATGHTYMPPSAAEAAKPAAQSRAGSPTLGPTDPDNTTSTAAAAAATTATDPAASTTLFSDDLFMQSLNMTLFYGDEYADENPITGEPGAFVFTNTGRAVDARNKALGQAALAAPAKSEVQVLTPSAAPSVAATPVASVAADGKAGGVGLPREKEKEKEGKMKRRKSKGLASPTTRPSTPKVL
ncbi:hypothetical protein P153DRAFT_367301 [Dothidotthia symphoricarpi CBS 119687]|uniref:Mediator of RNA polymerase II transcription subunit 6 n=1 Tax=Dothidotthia symphoricarpi CBS 119687 TaxID=1392245 RepID=A0A6A6ADQ6_9PLEO|nr:uncharacterized protein P153DRAFT_367301 [Dothidotthia symphoricarpi CBS 119687]KAF2129017.1 hypothetical protein P153DRAFT_367301 [Dothidotthia symphoricarpi CBS 119687]